MVSTLLSELLLYNWKYNGYKYIRQSLGYIIDVFNLFVDINRFYDFSCAIKIIKLINIDECIICVSLKLLTVYFYHYIYKKAKEMNVIFQVGVPLSDVSDQKSRGTFYCLWDRQSDWRPMVSKWSSQMPNHKMKFHPID